MNGRVIKKYVNRKLYDTKDSQYISLEDLVDYIERDEDFKVIDNNTKKDITAKTILFALAYSSKEISIHDAKTLILTNGGL